MSIQPPSLPSFFAFPAREENRLVTDLQTLMKNSEKPLSLSGMHEILLNLPRHLRFRGAYYIDHIMINGIDRLNVWSALLLLESCAQKDGHFDESKAANDFASFLQSIRSQGYNFNAPLSCNQSRPLHVAAQIGSSALCRALISVGADIDSVQNPSCEYTALHVALIHGQQNTARVLLDRKSSCSAPASFDTHNACSLLLQKILRFIEKRNRSPSVWHLAATIEKIDRAVHALSDIQGHILPPCQILQGHELQILPVEQTIAWRHRAESTFAALHTKYRRQIPPYSKEKWIETALIFHANIHALQKYLKK